MRGRRCGGANARWSRAAWTAGALALAVGSTGTPRAASAQVVIAPDTAPRFEWSGQLASDFRNDFETDLDGGDEFEAWQLGVAGDFGGPINESILVGMRAGYHYAKYDFRLDNGTGIPPTYGGRELPKDPWGSINTVDLAPTATVLVGSRVSLVGAVPIRWAGESGARDNGWIAGINGLVRWQVTDRLAVGAGIGVTSQLEDDAETFPIVSLDWQLTEALRLRTEGSWAQGGQAVLLWGPAEAIALSVSAGYERVRFRLDDNGFQADRDGIGEITAIPIEVGFRFRLFEGAWFDFRAGLGVAGRLRVEDERGNKLYDQDYDPAPRVGIALTIPLRLPAGRPSAQP